MCRKKQVRKFHVIFFVCGGYWFDVNYEINEHMFTIATQETVTIVPKFRLVAHQGTYTILNT